MYLCFFCNHNSQSSDDAISELVINMSVIFGFTWYLNSKLTYIFCEHRKIDGFDQNCLILRHIEFLFCCNRTSEWKWLIESEMKANLMLLCRLPLLISKIVKFHIFALCKPLINEQLTAILTSISLIGLWTFVGRLCLYAV